MKPFVKFILILIIVFIMLLNYKIFDFSTFSFAKSENLSKEDTKEITNIIYYKNQFSTSKDDTYAIVYSTKQNKHYIAFSDDLTALALEIGKEFTNTINYIDVIPFWIFAVGITIILFIPKPKKQNQKDNEEEEEEMEEEGEKKGNNILNENNKIENTQKNYIDTINEEFNEKFKISNDIFN